MFSVCAGRHVSIIVEWDNSSHTELGRSRTMLKIVAEQTADYLKRSGAAVQLILAYDKADASEAEIFQIVQSTWGNVLAQVEFLSLPLPGSSYYIQKNLGAQCATGDIVVYVDCDVLPQPHWLEHLLQPFDNPAVGVSQGVTYVEPHSTWHTGLAMAWLFPLQLSNGALTEQHKIVANNVAFRREVIRQYPYPELPTWRGQCTEQRKLCEQHGIGVHWSEHARVNHPFPLGLFGVIERAFLNGHDHATRDLLAGKTAHPWRTAYWRFVSLLRRARRRRQLMANEFPMSRWHLFAYEATALLYWGCGLLSECMVLACPRMWRRCLSDLPAKSHEI